jgi:hypothetical protein
MPPLTLELGSLEVEAGLFFVCLTDKTEAFPTPCGGPGDGTRVAGPGQTQ